MPTINRRSFLKSSLLAGAAVSFTARSWAQVAGANSDIRIAVAGFKSRGKSHIGEFTKMKGVRLVALCDADADVLEREVVRLRGQGIETKPFVDYRDLLEKGGIDAVSIASPNHWHALMAIWACQAGKDVYLEKPVSHNVWEGRKIVEAARKYQRIVQTGTQSRSSGDLKEAFAWIHAGNLGAIKVARGLCYKRRASIGKTSGEQPVPKSVNYDLWTGPAPMVPLRRKNLHYDWHWVWDTGNGDLGNQGIHQMDIARWALGVKTLSPAVFSVGGRLGYEDDGETANTQFVVHDYGKSLLIFEVRGLPASSSVEGMDKYRGQSVGVVVECENGYLSGATAYDRDGKQIKKFDAPDESHFANFIKAVRSRKVTDLNADILEGHLSSALCHTGNISLRLGRQETQGAIREKLKREPAALETLARMEEHLAANKVDINTSRLTLGVPLKMNAAKETFKGNKLASAMLTREYRAPFIVPARV